MEKIRNLSLRRSFLLYLVAAMILSFAVSVALRAGAENFQFYLYRKNISDEQYARAMDDIGYEENLARWGSLHGVPLSDMERFLAESCDFVITWSGLLVPVCGCAAAIFIFYRKKIHPPLEEMERSLEAVSRGEWDTAIQYRNEDELGQLCAKFESMRLQLKDNNRRLWGMVEEEKALRAAIAHDIRSPLAVLRGYQEMLLEFVPQERIEKDKIMEILRTGMEQIDRLNQFVDTMRELSRLEERKVVCQSVSMEKLVRRASETGRMLSQQAGKRFRITRSGKREILADSELILEVYENLLTNALRYARQEVQVSFDAGDRYLTVTVRDDGEGFQADADTVTKAYYHSNPQNPLDDLKHFGLGLYLCRMYCEKHGGRLTMTNSPGACVQASFREE